MDHQAVGAAISTISSNLPEMAKGVKLIAALMENEQDDDRLMDATRKLCKAFSDLLNAAKPEAKEVSSLYPTPLHSTPLHPRSKISPFEDKKFQNYRPTCQLSRDNWIGITICVNSDVQLVLYRICSLRPPTHSLTQSLMGPPSAFSA